MSLTGSSCNSTDTAIARGLILLLGSTELPTGRRAKPPTTGLTQLSAAAVEGSDLRGLTAVKLLCRNAAAVVLDARWFQDGDDAATVTTVVPSPSNRPASLATFPPETMVVAPSLAKPAVDDVMRKRKNPPPAVHMFLEQTLRDSPLTEHDGLSVFSPCFYPSWSPRVFVLLLRSRGCGKCDNLAARLTATPPRVFFVAFRHISITVPRRKSPAFLSTPWNVNVGSSKVPTVSVVRPRQRRGSKTPDGSTSPTADRLASLLWLDGKEGAVFQKLLSPFCCSAASSCPKLSSTVLPDGASCMCSLQGRCYFEQLANSHLICRKVVLLHPVVLSLSLRVRWSLFPAPFLNSR